MYARLVGTSVNRKTAILRLSSLVVAVFASACTLLVDTSDLDTGGATKDGGPDVGADVFDAGEPNDASDAEAGVDACSLQPVVNVSVPLPASEFTLRGGAYEDATNGIVLTKQVADQAGAIWRNEGELFEHFDVTATIRIEGGSEIADGMTFAWVAGDAVPDVGPNGGGLGVAGLVGYAVSVDTYRDIPGNPFVGVLDAQMAGTPLTQADLPTASVLGADHTMRIQLESGGRVTVWFDGAMRITRYTIPSYVSFRGHWGFTASTGGKFSAQRLVRASYSNTALPCP